MDPSRKPVIILSGEHAGKEGVCLGRAPDGEKWAVSPDDGNEIVYLEFEKEFGVLLNEGQDVGTN